MAFTFVFTAELLASVALIPAMAVIYLKFLWTICTAEIEGGKDKFIKAQLFDAHSRVNKGFNEMLTVCKQLKSDIPMHSENEKRLNALLDKATKEFINRNRFSTDKNNS